MGILFDIGRFEFKIVATDFFERNLQSFLGQVNVQPPWVRGNVPVVYFHVILSDLG